MICQEHGDMFCTCTREMFTFAGFVDSYLIYNTTKNGGNYYGK